MFKIMSVILCMATLNICAATKPNIIYILADDLGYGDIGCFGQKIIKTPSFDQLAKEGMIFTRNYSGSTVCAPSRCVLMTGLHTGNSRIRGNGKMLLQPKDITVAQVLKKQGYVTGNFGKWGIGHPPPDDNPNTFGFDEFYGYVNMFHAHNFYPDYMVHNGKKEKLRNVQMDEYKGYLEKYPDREGAGVAKVAIDYAPDLIRAKMFEFLENNHDKTFFLLYTPNTPHANNEGGKHGRGMEVPNYGEFQNTDWPVQEKGFAKMIRDLDNDIGKLIAKLKEYGIDDKTLIIFSSDNGPHQEGGHKVDFFDSNGEKRGWKRDLYEGGVRVPMITRWPGVIPAGKVNSSMVAFQDLMPTCAMLSGAQCPKTDGISMMPMLTGKKMNNINRSLYWEFPEQKGKQAILKGNWKLIRLNSKKPYMELYNVEEDPKEKTDLSKKHPERVAEMLKEMISIPDKKTVF